MRPKRGERLSKYVLRAWLREIAPVAAWCVGIAGLATVFMLILNR